MPYQSGFRIGVVELAAKKCGLKEKTMRRGKEWFQRIGSLNVPSSGHNECVVRLLVDRDSDRVPFEDPTGGVQFRELYALESHAWTFFEIPGFVGGFGTRGSANCRFRNSVCWVGDREQSIFTSVN